MKKNKLSFCITTFNRARFISETLNSIISQITDEVEIVIVDGASADNTEQIIKDYQQNYPQLHYYRQEKNMGVDRDFNNAVERAQGEYCWLMTDDDILKPGAVMTVLNALSRHDYALIIVNAEVRTKDFSKVIHQNMLEFSTDRTYHPQDNHNLFIETAKYLSFIGGVIIERALWMGREREQYFGSAFIHMGVIFQKPLSKDVFVIANPWIVIRYGNALWTPKGFEIWMFKWPKLIWAFSNYSDEAKRKIINQKPWKKIKTLTLFRAVGAFSLNEYRLFLKPRMDSAWNSIPAKIVAVMPPAILNFLWIIYISFFHRKSPMWLYDLKNSRFNHLSNLFKKGV